MDELIFDIIADENAEMIQEINSIVNEAIRVLIARGMYDAGVTVKIHVSLESAGQEDGSVLLVPSFETKTGFKIGANFEGKKLRTRCGKGLRRTKAGYWETRETDEQLSMVK